MNMSPTAAPLRTLTVVSIAALAVLSLLWELWLAPARPGGSLLALKAVPLLAALPAIRRGHIKAYQWWSMLILLYVCEGVVRGMSDATLDQPDAGMDRIRPGRQRIRADHPLCAGHAGSTRSVGSARIRTRQILRL